MDKNDCCCERMFEAITRDKIIEYQMVDRTYGILFGEFAGQSCISFLRYCPWCGSELKKRLVDELFYILRTEYGIKDPDLYEFTNVPEEFKTDEWWKKRGL